MHERQYYCFTLVSKNNCTSSLFDNAKTLKTGDNTPNKTEGDFKYILPQVRKINLETKIKETQIKPSDHYC